SPSRTAAPSSAPIRARAARASVTSLASSGDTSMGTSVASGIRVLPLLFGGSVVGLVLVGPPDQDGVDPVPAAGGALGDQQQAAELGAGAGDRHAAERLGEQAGDRLDLVGRQLDPEDLAEILDRQAAGDPDGAVGQLL